MQNRFSSIFLSFVVASVCLADEPNPMPLPQVAHDYQIVPGDVLDISVWKEEGLANKVLVRPDGGISFPLVGSIRAEGLTVDQLKNEIAKKLSVYLSDPEISVSVITTNQKVHVVGKVNKPGEVLMSAPITVMQALSMAGGLATFADDDDIIIIRRLGDQTISLPFDYGSVSNGEDLDQNIQLMNGDVILVP